MARRIGALRREALGGRATLASWRAALGDGERFRGVESGGENASDPHGQAPCVASIRPGFLLAELTTWERA